MVRRPARLAVRDEIARSAVRVERLHRAHSRLRRPMLPITSSQRLSRPVSATPFGSGIFLCRAGLRRATLSRSPIQMHTTRCGRFFAGVTCPSGTGPASTMCPSIVTWFGLFELIVNCVTQERTHSRVEAPDIDRLGEKSSAPSSYRMRDCDHVCPSRGLPASRVPPRVFSSRPTPQHARHHPSTSPSGGPR